MLVTDALSSDKQKKLEKFGFKCINTGLPLNYKEFCFEGGIYIFHEEQLKQVLQQNFNLYNEFKSSEELISYIKGFIEIYSLEREVAARSKEFNINRVALGSLEFAIKYFCKLRKNVTDSNKKQKIQIILELLEKQAKLLLGAYKNLEQVATYGANWMPYGEITNETKEKVNRLNAAFSQSKIEHTIKRTFAESVYKENFHRIRKLESAIKNIKSLLSKANV